MFTAEEVKYDEEHSERREREQERAEEETRRIRQPHSIFNLTKRVSEEPGGEDVNEE